MADPWECRGITWEVEEVTVYVKDHQAILKARVKWRAGETSPEVMNEQVTITYENKDQYYHLDFNIDFTPLIELELGGSDDEKGYGGFSTRFQLGKNVEFSGASGDVTPATTQVQAGSWIKMSDLGVNQVYLVLMYHPESTAELQGWILRKEGSMQNPVWPGRQRVMLHPSKGFTINARLVVFKDLSPSSKEIGEMYQEFATN